MGMATFLYEVTGSRPDEQSLQASQIEQSLSELGKPTAVVATLAELNCNNHNQIRAAILQALLPSVATGPVVVSKPAVVSQPECVSSPSEPKSKCCPSWCPS